MINSLKNTIILTVLIVLFPPVNGWGKNRHVFSMQAIFFLLIFSLPF